MNIKAMLVGLACLMVLAPVSGALACSCLQSTESEHFARADVVFLGTVVRRHELNTLWSFAVPGPSVVWTFAVDGVGKGEAAARQEVLTSTSSASCGADFQAGRHYLVFARRSDSGLATDLCSGNRPADGSEVFAGAPTAAATAPPNARGILALASGVVLVGLTAYRRRLRGALSHARRRYWLVSPLSFVVGRLFPAGFPIGVGLVCLGLGFLLPQGYVADVLTLLAIPLLGAGLVLLISNRSSLLAPSQSDSP